MGNKTSTETSSDSRTRAGNEADRVLPRDDSMQAEVGFFVKCVWIRFVYDSHMMEDVAVHVVRQYGPFPNLATAENYSQHSLQQGCSGQHTCFFAEAARVNPKPTPILWGAVEGCAIGSEK